MSNREEILKSLEPLFTQAKREHKWFHCSYQDLKFSPKELRKHHEAGSFIWGPVNWNLIDPPKPIDITKEVKRLERENQTMAKRIAEGWL